MINVDKSVSGCLAWIVAALAFMSLTPASYATPKIESYAPDSASLPTIDIPANGQVRVAFVADASSGQTTLAIKEFTGKNGEPIDVKFLIGDQATTETTVSADQARILFTLAVDGAKPGVVYTGEVWVRTGDKPPEPVVLSLQRPPPAHFLVVPAGASKEIVPVSSNGAAQLNIDVRSLRNGANKARLTISPFRGIDTGAVVNVYPEIAPEGVGKTAAESPVAKSNRQTLIPEFDLKNDFLTVRLDASELPVGEKFEGKMTVESGAGNLIVYLELARRAMINNAALKLDEPVLVFEAVCLWLWGGCIPDAKFVILSEDAGDESLVGVNVTTAQAPAEPQNANILPKDALNVRFHHIGNRQAVADKPADADKQAASIKRVPHRRALAYKPVAISKQAVADKPPTADRQTAGVSLFGIDPENLRNVEQRTITRGSRQAVRVDILDPLDAGIYKTSLEFSALNASPGKSAILPITVRVERHWFWALLVLIAGVFTSYVMNKGIATMNQRAAILKKIQRLRQNYWLCLDGSGTEPIVRARAHIAKIREAMSREKCLAKLAVPTVVNEEIDQLEDHLPFLERLSACMAHWNGIDTYVARRARKALRSLVVKIQSVPLESKPGTTVENAVAEMEQWQSDSFGAERYLQHLRHDIDELLPRITERELDDNSRARITQAFDRVANCLPEIDDLVEATEVLRSVKTTAPGAADIDGLVAAFENLTAIYKSLADAITEMRDGVIRMSPQSAMGSSEGITGSIASKFDEEMDKASRPGHALRAGLPLLTGLTPASLQQKVDQIAASLESLISIESSALQTALDDVRAAEAELFSSATAVKAWLASVVRRDRDATDLGQGVALEKVYSALKVIHESRSDAELTARLLDSYREKRDPEALFEITDDAAWANLQGKLEITGPSNATDDASKQFGKGDSGDEVYLPIKFRVEPNPEELGNNFLFKHGLTFHWTITMPGRPLKPVTTEPTVTQFIPVENTRIKVEVEVRYKRSPDPAEEIKAIYFQTVKSDEFGFLKSVNRAELLNVGLALGFAVVTGFNTEYLKADLLGSFGDYLGLFIWGFVADQAKNIIQNIGSNRGQTA